jgi:hypothetical protein
MKKGLIIAVTILSFLYIEKLQALNVSYKYDSLSRLEEVLYENVAKIEYTYDAAGNRLSQTVNAFNLQGDINGDGTVNLTDAILALQITVGLKPTDLNLTGDVDGDGKIGMAEAIYAIQKVAGL